MADFTVRSDSVNVEQIMEQVRERIREKRGIDYTEQQIHELAEVKLEQFLDPRGVRSDLLDQFRRARPAYEPPNLPNYQFEDQTLYESHRGPLRLIRKLLQPILKLFFNPNPLIQALNIQSRLNTAYAEREARRETVRHAFDQLHYEVMHNLVMETTRLGIEVKNLKMRVESLTSRLEFNERRARALESVVAYKPTDDRPPAPPPPPPPPPPARERRTEEPARQVAQPSAQPSAPSPSTEAQTSQPQGEGPGQRSRRRRRRRGRRGGGSAAGIMGGQPGTTGADGGDNAPAPEAFSSGNAEQGFQGDGPDDYDGPDSGGTDPSDQES